MMIKETVSKLLKGKKAVLIVTAAALIGAALMLTGKSGKKTETFDEISEYERAAENKIEQTAEAICGGKALVIVTAEYGRTTEYAKNRTGEDEATVISAGSPVPVRTAAPVIRGITVVCKNGNDPVICRRITEALSCAYGVSSAKIFVTSFR